MLVEYTQIIRNAEVKSRRLRMGLTQQQLAEKLGISKSAIGQLETFRSAPETVVRKVAGFFDVDPDALVPPWLRAVTRERRSLRMAKDRAEKGWTRKNMVRRIPTQLTSYHEVGSIQFEQLVMESACRLKAPQMSAHALAELGEGADHAMKALEALPRDEKEILESYCTGYSMEQIARKLKRSKTRVFQLLNKGIQHIWDTFPGSMKKYTEEEIGSLVSWGLLGSRPDHITRNKMKALMGEAPRGTGKPSLQGG